MSENLTPDQRFNELVPSLLFAQEDIQLRAVAYPFLIRLDAKGWLDIAEARDLRDWLNKVIP